MATRYIYLQDELNNRLKGEENASALICMLLNKHYETFGKTDEQIINEVKEKINTAEMKEEKEMEKLKNPHFVGIIGRDMTKEEYDEFWEGYMNQRWNVVSYAELIVKPRELKNG